MQGQVGNQRRRNQCWSEVDQLQARLESPPFHPINLFGGQISNYVGQFKGQHTKQFDLQADLCESLHKSSSFLRGYMSTISSQHVQTVRPIRPTWRIRCNKIRQGALVGAQQWKRKWGRHRRWIRRKLVLVTKNIWRRSASSASDFAYQRKVDPFRKIFETVTYRKFHCTVDIM